MAVLASTTSRLTHPILWLILLAATFFRFYALAGQSLWSDEGNSVALARRSLAEIAQRTAFDIHPPLYYWLLKIWVGLFGDSEVGLRSLSAVLGVICVYFIWWLGCHLFDRRVGLTAALIAALSPFQIYYSQEARMYMLLTLLGTLTILLMVLISEQPGNLWLKVGYVATVTAGLYTHYAYPVVWAVAVMAGSGSQILGRHNSPPSREGLGEGEIPANNQREGVKSTRLLDRLPGRTESQTLRASGDATPSQPPPARGRSQKLPSSGWDNSEADRVDIEATESPPGLSQGGEKRQNSPRWGAREATSDTRTPFLSALEPARGRLVGMKTWILLQLVPFILYLPWLPTAWRQVTTWPSEPQGDLLAMIMPTVVETLLFGLSWPYDTGWLAVVGLTIVLGLAIFGGGYRFSMLGGERVSAPKSIDKTIPPDSQPPTPAFYSTFLLFIWFLAPVILTIIIFSPAFLKFLLVATPPLAILLALGIVQLARLAQPRWLGLSLSSVFLAMLTVASLLSLYNYYTDNSLARDNYRGIVQFIKAVGGSEDAVILNAEGQQDVFGYYFEREPALAAPVYPLPQRRPLDKAATVVELERIAANSDKIYAVYWASQQADPEGIIEQWLDTYLFKATDQWYGNVRLVSYATAQTDLPFRSVDYRWANSIRLVGAALSATKITAGDILQVSLQWQTNTSLDENYTVFLQILDANNHLVGQRDAALLTPTSAWPVDAPVVDSHGIFIEPGTPPGQHRLIMGLYHSETGQRLQLAGAETAQDFIVLGEVEIAQSEVLLPEGAFDMQQPVGVTQSGLRLVGYDFYKLGHRSTPETPLQPGEPIQLVAYWSLATIDNRLADEIEIEIIDSQDQSVGEVIERPLAGGDYPLVQWQPGEIVRAQYSFPLQIEPGNYRLRLTVAGRNGSQSFETTTQTFRVE